MPAAVITVRPSVLAFGSRSARSDSVLTLTSSSDSLCIFKLRVTKPELYTATPRLGLVPPGGTATVTVTRKAGASGGSERFEVCWRLLTDVEAAAVTLYGQGRSAEGAALLPPGAAPDGDVFRALWRLPSDKVCTVPLQCLFGSAESSVEADADSKSMQTPQPRTPSAHSASAPVAVFGKRMAGSPSPVPPEAAAVDLRLPADADLWPIGTEVVACGLRNDVTLNGMVGRVIGHQRGAPNQPSGELFLQVDFAPPPERIAINPTNLRVAQSPSRPAPAIALSVNNVKPASEAASSRASRPASVVLPDHQRSSAAPTPTPMAHAPAAVAAPAPAPASCAGAVLQSAAEVAGGDMAASLQQPGSRASAPQDCAEAPAPWPAAGCQQSAPHGRRSSGDAADAAAEAAAEAAAAPSRPASKAVSTQPTPSPGSRRSSAMLHSRAITPPPPEALTGSMHDDKGAGPDFSGGTAAGCASSTTQRMMSETAARPVPDNTLESELISILRLCDNSRRDARVVQSAGTEPVQSRPALTTQAAGAAGRASPSMTPPAPRTPVAGPFTAASPATAAPGHELPIWSAPPKSPGPPFASAQAPAAMPATSVAAAGTAPPPRSPVNRSVVSPRRSNLPPAPLPWQQPIQDLGTVFNERPTRAAPGQWQAGTTRASAAAVQPKGRSDDGVAAHPQAWPHGDPPSWGAEATQPSVVTAQPAPESRPPQQDLVEKLLAGAVQAEARIDQLVSSVLALAPHLQTAA
eukprot:TRINITY_DN12998_c0_g1_i2.p1 TRINITY_DN12998_c0_g1~~TRINITY_DN12998_c0_g1_i2.p1  ORF type:complete len:763 (+),score=167.73 TRINITY_DN12998_c0_g1_i2:48-2291(+)